MKTDFQFSGVRMPCSSFIPHITKKRTHNYSICSTNPAIQFHWNWLMIIVKSFQLVFSNVNEKKKKQPSTQNKSIGIHESLRVNFVYVYIFVSFINVNNVPIFGEYSFMRMNYLDYLVITFYDLILGNKHSLFIVHCNHFDLNVNFMCECKNLTHYNMVGHWILCIHKTYRSIVHHSSFIVHIILNIDLQ